MAELNRTVVNNAILDPLQGFDTDVFVLDQATGKQILVGRFVSFQWTVRNTTEPYLEFNQRIPRLLDGEFQFGWVLERGLIDTRVLQNVLGFHHLGREMRPDRSPRLQITIEFNAPALKGNESSGNNTGAGQGGALAGPRSGEFMAGSQIGVSTRQVQGRYHLQNCKVDSMTLGATAGRNVVASRFEGLCEGYFYEDLATNEAAALRSGALPLVSELDTTGPTAIDAVGGLGAVLTDESFADWYGYFNSGN